MSTAIRSIEEDRWLNRISGWDDARTDREIRTGLPVDLVKHLQQLLNLTDEQAAQIIGRSRSTYSRYRSENKTLGIPEAERAIRYAQLLTLAAETFGSLAEALDWICEPNYALNNEAPLQTAETGPGAEMVRELLLGMQHGFPL